MEKGAPIAEIISKLDVVVRALPGELGHAALFAGKPLRSRVRGIGADSLLPLSFVMVAGPRRGRARERLQKLQPIRRLVNLQILFLIWMHGGEKVIRCDCELSAAPRRVQESLLIRACDFLRRSPNVVPRGAELRIHVRMNFTAYQDRAAAMPLGLAAGVPETAATCDVVETRRHHDPELSMVADDPNLTLLDFKDW